MIFDRKQQRLLLEGKEYTFEDISRLIAGGAEAHSPASWDLYLFLNEWFNDLLSSLFIHQALRVHLKS